MNQLEQLKKITHIVADSGDFLSIKPFSPLDSTTNPSLILEASKNPAYHPLLDEAIEYAKNSKNPSDILFFAMDRVLINFGKEILKHISGRVSVEIDARDSFNTKASFEKAKKIISMFEEENISRNRILIKLAATLEGIQAAKLLEKEGIHCNMTLIFSEAQAIFAAQEGATLISPFVGRILDWHLKQNPAKTFTPQEDPGVLFVKNLFQFFKKFDYKIQIMGASFRTKEEILELAGLDYLTISLKLLKELQNTSEPIFKKLSIEDAKNSKKEHLLMNEIKFTQELLKHPFAKEKLEEGINKFIQDTESLEKLILAKI